MSQEKRRLNTGPNRHLSGTGKPHHIGLSRRTLRLLEGRDWERYGSRYKAFMALVVGLVASGWSDDQIIQELSNPRRCKAAEILRDRYQGSPINQIRSKVGIARTEVNKHYADIDSWLTSFLNDCPRERSASIVRTAVALAVIARDSGNRTFTASVRQIAQVAGLGTATQTGADTKTVRRALKKLCELGFIERQVRSSQKKNEPRYMTEIRLKDRGRLEDPTIPRGITRDSGVGKRSSLFMGKFSYEEILHPLWEHSGLGFAAFRIWTVLRSRGDLTVSEVAEILGMSMSQVRKILTTRLGEYGLAFLIDESRWRFIDEDLDEVAESVGVIDRPNFRRTSFEIQRLNRRRALVRKLEQSEQATRTVPTWVDDRTGEILDRTCSDDV